MQLLRRSLTFGSLYLAGAVTALVGQPPPAPTATGLVLTCETFCSPTKLRTSDARLRWQVVPGPGITASGLGDLERAQVVLEATIFKDGFDKDLYVRLPVGRAGARLETQAVPQGAAAKRPLRAFDLRLIEATPSGSAQLFEAGQADMSAVVENLEPGVLYTFRLVAGASALRSPTVDCEAPICPADMVPKGDQQ